MKPTRVLLLLAALLPCALPAQEKVDLSVVHRIKEEAFLNSRVMDHLFYLTDVYGPRLTGSPGYKAAADWASKQLEAYGLKNVKQEKWGPFGRSWSCTRFSAHLLEPQYAVLIGVPLAWSPGTNGPVSGEVILTPFKREPTPKKMEAELARYFEANKGKLRGKVVLLGETKELEPPSDPLNKRYSDPDLAAEATSPIPVPLSTFDFSKLEVPEDPKKRAQFWDVVPWWISDAIWEKQDQLRDKMNRFLSEEGAKVVVVSSYRGDGGTIFGEHAGSYKPDAPEPPPTFALTVEHFDRIARLIEKKVPVRLQVEMETRFPKEPVDGFNVLAEIPGGKKKDEVVMVGAHFDSWAAGTGATDNGAGSAVVMEVLRILKALGLQMDRTVRLGLWGGEEQGYFGSRAYVKEHFADPETMMLGMAHAKLAGYFNIDNGSGKTRGVYLQNNDAARPIFEAWLAPFHDLGVTTISIRNTGGTDHLSFDAVGLPGFQFIQDPLEYDTRTHHSNMDVYDHVQAGDLRQASAVLASVVYHAALREEMMPRKPLPKPRPKN
ncbi:MAG: M20/M25/M40 family metallo-hydrolase [Acidobacteria bacterium]|nr:M20/M25/M40 family metallo-hydrolase [Acidobacteriota bacterium]